MGSESSAARRRFAVIGAAALLSSAAILWFAFPARGPRPDIVLFVWDTCRGDRVEANGYARPTTPRLVEIAKGGVVFRRAFTPSPWTPPAHASLFTGLLPRRHGLREAVGDRVRPGVPLLASTLRDEGYETVAFVANPQISGVTGLDGGFETVFRIYDTKLGKGVEGAVVAQVESWVARRRAQGGGRKPLFVFVNLMATHLPYTFDPDAMVRVHGDGSVEPAKDAVSRVDEQTANRVMFGGEKADAALLEPLSKGYDGAVCLADRATGEILDLLKDAGIDGSDFLAVCGDHGENLGEHGELGHIFSLHEPVLHVPLVVRWPGRFDGGRREDAQVRIHDLYPTLLAAAGVAVPEPCGSDAERLDAAPLRPRLVVAEYGPPLTYEAEARASMPGAPESCFERFRDQSLAVREPDGAGARKYIRVTRHDPGVPPRLLREVLYDLAADPGETRNLLDGRDAAERATADRLHGLAK